MASQKRGARSQARSNPGIGNRGGQGPALGAPFPIPMSDVVLYDLQIERFPVNADANSPDQSPTGTVNVDVLRPTVVGRRMEVGIKLRVAAPNEEVPVYAIGVIVNGVFQIEEGADQELIDSFAQTTALRLIWPYARELLQSLSLRMRVPPIMLPTLDLRPPPLGEDADDGQTSIQPESTPPASME